MRRGSHMRRLLLSIAFFTCPLSPFPFPGLSAQKRAIGFDDYIAMKSVGDPALSPDGKWVAYTVTEYSLKDNRGTTRIWLADLGTGDTRRLTEGPGSDRQPRWSPDGRVLAFVSTRPPQNGPQVWILPIGGGEARRVSNLPDGVSDPVWLPDGKGLIVTSDMKWRAGRRQHLFLVGLVDQSAKDLTPIDHDVPTIATEGSGDVAVSPDGREIAFAMHGDSVVADNTNVDVYVMRRDAAAGLQSITVNRGADHTPRYSPDGNWLSYLSMERPGFEADRLRLMLVGRTGGRTDGRTVEATAGWSLSVGSYTWCPDSKCVYAVVEERGRDNVYRIDLPSFRRSLALGGGGLNTSVAAAPDGKTLVYLHQSNTQPGELWVSGKPLTHHNDSALATLDLRPLDELGFVGALGDSVFGWVAKPPGFDPAKRYPLVYLVHGGPQGAWTDYWGSRWNYAMFASRGYVVAAVNFHGSTGYGQKFTDAISQHWGDYPYQDLMK